MIFGSVDKPVSYPNAADTVGKRGAGLWLPYAWLHTAAARSPRGTGMWSVIERSGMGHTSHPSVFRLLRPLG